MSLAAKPAVQQRSKRTRDALIGALEELLKRKEFASVSVADIAGRAGVSPASIYQRFSNKDAAVSILLELYLRRVEEWSASPEAAGEEIMTAPTLRDALMTLGVAAWRQFDALGHVMRPAYLYSRLRPDLLGAQWAERMAQAQAGFAALLGKHRGEIRRTDLNRAAGMVAAFYNMMFVGVLLHREDIARGASRPPENAESFAAELADFVIGYLAQPDAAAREGRSP